MIPRSRLPKKVTFKGLSLLLLFLLTACQPPQTNLTVTPTKAATRTPRPTSTPDSGTHLGIPKEALKGVTISVWHPWFEVEANLFESQVKEFNQSNEWGITVQAISQINYTQLYEHVTSSLPTADRPQLVVAFPEHALAWDPTGYVSDLNPYINDPQYGFTEADVGDFPSVFWTQDSLGGKRLGIPAERSARFLLYNASWGRDLGFDAPPKSATEFQVQACRAHQAMLINTDKTDDGQGGWLVDTDPMTLLSWMTAFGGGVLEGNNYRYLTPKNIAALTFVKQLYDDGCAWGAQPDTDPFLAFAGRKAMFATASLEELSEYARAMASAGSADEWTVMSFPGDIQSGLVIYGSSYVILKSTPEQQLASWLFVRWLLSPENQKKWVEVTGLFPLRRSTIDMLNDYKKSHPQWGTAVDLLPEAQIEPQLASWRKIRVMLGDGFQTMFSSNIPAGRVAELLAIMESTSRDLTK
jgi:ABC-type glycerol-3-phosphate transport system substrate-binding protein